MRILCETNKKKIVKILDNGEHYCRKFHKIAPYYSSHPRFEYKNIKENCLYRFCIQILHCWNNTALFIKIICNNALYCGDFGLIFLLVSHRNLYQADYLPANRLLFDPYIIFIAFYFPSEFLNIR